MNPKLLELVCSDSWQKLEAFLNREDGQGSELEGRQRASGDVEAFLQEPLLEGVTVGGDTVLHVVATYGRGDDDYAKDHETGVGVVHRKAQHLLFVQNENGDTPLHCAARAGNPATVSRLVRLAGDRAKELLEMKNELEEKALHEAVRIESNEIVCRLLKEDPELALIPQGGTSPMYLAISLEYEGIAKSIADVLRWKSYGILSYLDGPEGQNALHAAVLGNTALIEMILEWEVKNGLAKQADKNGSTPLHFASSLPWPAGGGVSWRFPWNDPQWRLGIPIARLLEVNPQQLYQPDREGLFAIHVAAASGAESTVVVLTRTYPKIAGLQDSRGRTFLHVAVEKRRQDIVSFACREASLAWILNIRDNNGNTALHLAVQLGSMGIFCSLLSNRGVRLNLGNNDGETPLDVSRRNLPAEYFHGWNSRNFMHEALVHCNAKHRNLRSDYFAQRKLVDEEKESQKLTDSTQVLGVGSVLIVSVTFGATFALPGGYKADDHTNGGTPTLAGRYAFDVFMIANTLAFVCSALATINFMYAGLALVDLPIRRRHFNISLIWVFSSLTSLIAAFATGVYLVLAPVARMTAVGICALVSLVSLFGYTKPLKTLSRGKSAT